MLAKHCPICDRLISHSDVICPDCRNSFEKELFDNFMTRCNNCGYPLVADLYECPHCREFHNFYVYSLSPYSSYFSRRILEFYKFNGKKSLSKFIAQCFDKHINDTDAVVTWVPCSPESLKKRGWDQMKEIALKMKNKAVCLLLNSGISVQQKTLTKEQRMTVSQNKYLLSENNAAMLSKTTPIILIDDVMTTGNTLYACYLLLKNYGFTDVRCMTLLCEL
ncbi:MAG: hypothetical protein MJ052_04960 [Sphaerochaetaceae bacterium]|nr:hypothetical protein [Sphaerochaetaceae bacterium]